MISERARLRDERRAPNKGLQTDVALPPSFVGRPTGLKPRTLDDAGRPPKC